MSRVSGRHYKKMHSKRFAMTVNCPRIDSSHSEHLIVRSLHCKMKFEMTLLNASCHFLAIYRLYLSLSLSLSLSYIGSKILLDIQDTRLAYVTVFQVCYTTVKIIHVAYTYDFLFVCKQIVAIMCYIWRMCLC